MMWIGQNDGPFELRRGLSRGSNQMPKHKRISTKPVQNDLHDMRAAKARKFSCAN